MSQRQHERRKSLIVNKQLQRRIILAVGLLPTLSLTAAAMIVAVFCRRLLGEAMRSEAELPSLVPLFLAVLGFVAVSGIIVLHQALRFSHRIAGPAYRFIKAMEQIRGGDVAFRVHLRKGDHLNEVADALNRLLDWLERYPPQGVPMRTDIVDVARRHTGSGSAAAAEAAPAAQG